LASREADECIGRGQGSRWGPPYRVLETAAPLRRGRRQRA